MKQRIALISGLLLAISLVAFAAADFSGTWSLDKAKSDPVRMGGGRPGGGGGGAPPADVDITLMIKQTDNDLQITRKMKMGDQERASEQKFTLDGKENKNPAEMGRGGEFISKSKWNKESLVIEGTQKMSTPNGEFEIASKSEYSLSDGGKVLTITRTMSTPQGERTTKQVFNKQ